MRELEISGYKVLIDDEDYERISILKWYVNSGKSVLRTSCGRKNGNNLRMANVIMKNTEVIYDHIDSNSLNNQKNNLREATMQQNAFNRKKQSGIYSSKYKGVSLNRQNGLWRATITLNREAIHLGQFKKEIDAAIAYNIKARELFGEFAKLNILPVVCLGLERNTRY